ncbi:MAG: CsgG/HfaB family protein [Planctomycetota bacterium]|jgi:curli biogenesis system outer membrane secretion channel CsgG
MSIRLVPLRWLAIAALGLAAGCASDTGYNIPPTAIGSASPGGLAPRGQRVVVVGEFRNPVRSQVPWSDVGRGVARSLALSLLNEGHFDVWSNQELAVEVETALRGPTHERAGRLAALNERHEDVQYVITGQVTDFHYTSEVSEEVRRRSSWFGGKKEEAIVAIQFQVVDLQAHRLILADHVHGIAPIKQSESQPVYANIAFGSYLFWNSPLGRATENAIRSAMSRIESVVPSGPRELRILEHLAGREVRITGGNVRVGDQLYVCTGAGSTARAVLDRHTGAPLSVRIIAAEGNDVRGWLGGEPPPDVDLAGAELRPSLPARPAAEAAVVPDDG